MVQQEISDNIHTSSSPSQLQEEAREVRRRRKKKRSGSTLVASHFLDLYKLTGEVLGRGSCGSVQVCHSIYTSEEYAVKIIEKTPDLCRSKVFKEIEMMHYCQGHNTIIQLVEYFEEEDKFYLVFEKANGGSLLSRLHKNFRFTEKEASLIMHDLATALDFLHQKGIAHCDIKLENILCVSPDKVYPVKMCDFDLASESKAACGVESVSTPDIYAPVGTAEYMAPEVVRGYKYFDNDPYDKRCDLWSLGVCLYFMLCGYHPFTADCGDENCDWNLGGDCEVCLGLLFDNIDNCKFEFPEEEWANISDDAKNLIRQLLVEEPSERISAKNILNHPWVVNSGLTRKESELHESVDTSVNIPSNLEGNMTMQFMCASDEVQFNEVTGNRREGKEKEQNINHLNDSRKHPLQSRSSVEDWQDHSEHNSWRSIPKIDMGDQRTQNLLIYFDSQMKMYELVKEKFRIGRNEAESFIDDLSMMEPIQLSPPSSRLAKRRHGRRIQSPYHSTHLISAC